jgi:hypothetical protein
MTNGIIIDNWLLQDVGDCLANGLYQNDVSEIVINTEKDAHSFKDVPHAGIQIEGLLDFLGDIVLRDSIYFDSKFMNTWEDTAPVFSAVTKTGLMRPVAFLEREHLLNEPRKVMVDILCVTTSLKMAQKENEISWGQNRRTKDSFMSSLIWGTAGFLSRSHVFEAPYHGHPSRKRLLDQTLFLPPTPDAVSELKEWVSSERLRIFQMKTPNGVMRRAHLVLPPISIEILNEAQSISELIPIAYQKRDKYRHVREWLKEIQTSLDSGNANPAVKFKKKLMAISRDLDGALGMRDEMPISLGFTYGFPDVSVEIPVMSGIRKRFGMSATLKKMLFTNRGTDALKHLLIMFGEERKDMELKVQSYLQRVGA